MAEKQGKDRRAGSSAGVRNTGQGNMDTGIASPTIASGAKSAVQRSDSSSKGGTTGVKLTPVTTQQPGGPSPQNTATGQAKDAGAVVAGNTAADAAPKSPPLDKVQALGHALWLMTQSPAHRHMFIADMEWVLIPPVSLGQFRLWRHGNQPIGFVTWAFVSDEVDERLRNGGVKLKPQDWKSGEKVWLVDVIMPLGGREEGLKELKEKVFPDRVIHVLGITQAGSIQSMEL